MKSIKDIIKESNRPKAEEVFAQITDLAAELSTILQTELDLFNAGDLDEYFPKSDSAAQKEKKDQMSACEKGLDALQALLAAYEY